MIEPTQTGEEAGAVVLAPVQQGSPLFSGIILHSVHALLLSVLRPNVTPGVVGHAGSVPYPVGTAACAGTVTAMANRARTAPVHSPAILHERVMRRASRRVRRGATRVSGL